MIGEAWKNMSNKTKSNVILIVKGDDNLDESDKQGWQDEMNIRDNLIS